MNPDAPYDLDPERLSGHRSIVEVEYHDTIGSTNDRAREWAGERPGAVGLLVLAEEQTAGRGRGANRWWTGRGAIAGSLLIDPAGRGIARQHSGLLALATAVAIVEAIALRAAGLPCGLHWPNDVYVGDRKLAGILVESLADGRGVIGLGCNVNNRLSAAPWELQPIVASLVDLTGQEHNRTALWLDILDGLDTALEQLSSRPEVLARRANELCLQIGMTLTVLQGDVSTTGLCAGIADDGALRLDTPTGEQRLYAGVLAKAVPRY